MASLLPSGFWSWASNARLDPAAQGLGESVQVIPVPRISGALLFRPVPHVDERGFFSRTFDANVMREAGVNPDSFVQDSLSRSARGVLRGLHLRSGHGEAKLVRCSYGAVFDVIVDLRPASATYRNWESFQALPDPADVSYRIDREHDPSEDVTIAHDDSDLGIPWPLPVTVISGRDRSAPSLASVTELLSLPGRLSRATLFSRSLAALSDCGLDVRSLKCRHTKIIYGGSRRFTSDQVKGR
jgi:dTDP-4-dehydrorhamnose 3,5-epimerase